MSGDLLTPVVPQVKLHRSFELLLTQLHNEPARDLLRKLWTVFPNPDNHFIREFQTTHFDARLWELYVVAFGGSGAFVGRDTSMRTGSEPLALTRGRCKVSEMNTPSRSAPCS